MQKQTQDAVDVPDPDAAPAYVVFNPVAGTTDAEQFRALLAERFAARGRAYELYETTGADDEDVGALVRVAYAGGVRTFGAAGGDGTVAAVADGLADSADVWLALLPVGTANVLATELGVPGDIAAAIELLLDAPAARAIDVMRVGARCFVLHIGAGVNSLMHRDTSREAKRRFGRMAYVLNAMRWVFDFQPERFSIVVDGVRYRHSASLVTVANAGTLGAQPFRWAEAVEPDDGHVDVCVIYARTLRDYLAIGWSALTGRHRFNQRIKVYPARRSVSLNTRHPLPVQGDGELIGDTPVLITVAPACLRVIVPAPA